MVSAPAGSARGVPLNIDFGYSKGFNDIGATSWKTYSLGISAGSPKIKITNPVSGKPYFLGGVMGASYEPSTFSKQLFPKTK